jgi:hypothetical protein
LSQVEKVGNIEKDIIEHSNEFIGIMEKVQIVMKGDLNEDALTGTVFTNQQDTYNNIKLDDFLEKMLKIKNDFHHIINEVYSIHNKDYTETQIDNYSMVINNLKQIKEKINK